MFYALFWGRRCLEASPSHLYGLLMSTRPTESIGKSTPKWCHGRVGRSKVVLSPFSGGTKDSELPVELLGAASNRLADLLQDQSRRIGGTGQVSVKKCRQKREPQASSRWASTR
ncbi:hypothetical protein GCM10009811_01750 [Nostocoides veronense]|uniref:Transposase n=1 Tax=Nostocoides veronense TaxID=330836 RepID=A0ABN2L9C2_9MICO